MGRITFDKICKSFAGPVVVRDLDLEIADGEFLILVGPSGCGKSTSLRMVAGLEKITSVKLWIGDKLVNGLSPKARNVAMVFQSYALYPNMTVRQNLAFGMQVRREPKEHITQEVERVATLLGLGPFLERKPRALSGGQAQRVAFGRAMIRHPDAFLFDEPLSNLDAELRVQMRGEIAALQRSLGTTTLYVTHDQTEAMTLGDRVAVMRAGALMQVGRPLDLYEDPDNSFVAGFIGSPKMNLQSLHVEDGFLAFADGVSLPVPSVARSAIGDRQEVTFGVRPEHIQLLAAAETRAGQMAPLRRRVSLVEALGHETLVHCDAPGGSLVARASDDQHRRINAGDEVRLGLVERQVKFFDNETGQRLRQRE